MQNLLYMTAIPAQATAADVGIKIVDNTSNAISSVVRGTGYVVLKTAGTLGNIAGISTAIFGGVAGGSLIYSSFVYEVAEKTFWEKTKGYVFNSYLSSYTPGPGTCFAVGITLAGIVAPIAYLSGRKFNNMTNDLANRLVK